MRSPTTEPILVELGEDRWAALIDSVEAWLRNVRLAQSSFRHLAQDTAGKIDDPRLKEQMERIAETAKRHEEQVDALYALIERKPPGRTGMLGEAAAKGRQALGNVLGITGGAPGAWPDLRQMLLSNLNAIGAFGAVEQLGLTLGLPELAEVAFTIVREKSTDQLVIEEFMLELAPQAILYEDERLGRPTDHEPAQPPAGSSAQMQPQLPKPGKPDAPLVGTEMDRDRE
ncbi:MAG: hypothetical protein M3173_00860 [Chloroflexota bacterium]|nr:hypothetical protein [Chloroflexota bacterium]